MWSMVLVAAISIALLHDFTLNRRLYTVHITTKELIKKTLFLHHFVRHDLTVTYIYIATKSIKEFLP